MKSIIKLSILTVSLVIASSCSLIEEEVYSFKSETNFYQSEADAILAINGAYDVFHRQGYLRYLYFQVLSHISPGFGGKGINTNAKQTELIRLIFTSASGEIAEIWREHYRQINQVNDIIVHLDGNEKIKQETTVTPNIIIVSDHGMTTINKAQAIKWKSLFVKFPKVKVINGQTQLYIYEENDTTLNDVRSHLSLGLKNKEFEITDKSNYPKHWRFNITNAVVPDMVINARPPVIFIDEKSHIGAATHGYDAKNNAELSAIFIAQGPDIKSNLQINSFESIHVFSLLENLLGLIPSTSVDSNVNLLSSIIELR
mgnify:CR=1 FL=1